MSTPSPRPSRPPSAASRYLFVLLVGLVMGAIGAVMATRALDARKDHFPDSVMNVLAWHTGKLQENVKQNRCGATDTVPHLNALRAMANDVEPAFGEAANDERFKTHAGNLRGALDSALASPPLNCAGVGVVTGKIGETCKGCHQDFRK